MPSCPHHIVVLPHAHSRPRGVGILTLALWPLRRRAVVLVAALAAFVVVVPSR